MLISAEFNGLIRMKIIENSQDLLKFCETLNKEPFIAVDLEFLREKTYYAKLCLIQVASQNDAAIIDPLAPGLKLEAFYAVLHNPEIVKVFHSGRQDIEIIYNMGGFIPEPIFDTQIAAQVCGFGESVSYENLVKNILGIELDKSCRLSNWSLRPLDAGQLEYALSDVTHLVHLYENLRAVLAENGRLHWMDEEADILKNPETYVVHPQDAWQKIKHRSHNGKFLTVLRELAAWRERRAQRKDTPRQSIIKDDCLLNIAAFCPSCQEELEQIRNIRKDITGGKLAGEILEVIRKALKISPSEYIKPEREKMLPPGAASLYELLKLLLKIKAQEEGVAAKMIASDDDIKRLACFSDRNNPVLKGWRKEIFGEDALALRNGCLTISYNNQKHCTEITKKAGD